MSEREKERAARQAEIARAVAAEQILANPAVQFYFDQVERSAMEALLACEDPAGLDRLRVGALTVRKVRSFLTEARDAGEFARAMLERMDKEDEAMDGRIRKGGAE